MISNMLSFHQSQTIHYISDHFSFIFFSSRIGQHVGLGKRAGKRTNTELSCKNKDRPKKEASDGLLSHSSSIPVPPVSVNAGSTSSPLPSPPAVQALSGSPCQRGKQGTRHGHFQIFHPAFPLRALKLVRSPTTRSKGKNR